MEWLMDKDLTILIIMIGIVAALFMCVHEDTYTQTLEQAKKELLYHQSKIISRP
jgi:hypothetical protein